MKSNLFILFACVLALVACKEQPKDEPVSPQSTSCTCSLNEGDEVVASNLTEITLTFFRPATIQKAELITLNDQVLSATLNPNDKAIVILTLPVLTEATSYTLHVGAGAITAKYGDSDNRANKELTIHFKTKESAIAKIDTTLCNADAIGSAKNVYRYLLSQYGKKILSSTIANVNWNFSEANLVYQATGKYPAIATMDYIHMFTLTSHNPFEYWQVPYNDTKAVEEWWNNNGLIAACWHWNMPANKDAIMSTDGYTCTPGSGTITKDGATTCVTPSMIMDETSWVYEIAQEDLTKMVELLKLLQDKGIPVIWRPFHEASGNTYGQYAGGGAWFWWGKEGAEKYKKLWRYLYDFFKTNGVNNLIWVWTSQNNGDDDWYPGDEYVDIIGQDIYNKNAASNAEDFRRLQATYPNKMVTLSECGNVGKISEQWHNGAYWSYVMPWYEYNAGSLDNHQHANTEWWVDAMKFPGTISREDLPSLK